MSRVLLIGSGGREHALAWKIAQSPKLEKLYIAPGNPGTKDVGENVSIAATDIPALVHFAESHQIDLTIVGPDDPLALGIVDEFQRHKLRIFGPTKAAARIESSKAFAKQLMKDAGIPTAAFGTFTSYEEALAYVREQARRAVEDSERSESLLSLPSDADKKPAQGFLVVKASGLALGKGVVVCMTLEEAEAALKSMMVDKVFNDAGGEVVIEEYLLGPEISVHAISDGVSHITFPPAQDHKRALDGDMGKNTGGMGTIAPLPWVTEDMMREIDAKIVKPALDALAFAGAQFRGLLFPGVIMTSDGPKVLEFNARFGDPETQVYMRLMKSDLLELLDNAVEQKLDGTSIHWSGECAANIVLASGGYPDAYEKGKEITGVDEANKRPDVVVFHAGTAHDAGPLRTAGGRVLGVSATGRPLKQALEKAYAAAGEIQFEGKQMRRDIGAKSL